MWSNLSKSTAWSNLISTWLGWNDEHPLHTLSCLSIASRSILKIHAYTSSPLSISLMLNSNSALTRCAFVWEALYWCHTCLHIQGLFFLLDSMCYSQSFFSLSNCIMVIKMLKQHSKEGVTMIDSEPLIYSYSLTHSLTHSLTLTEGRWIFHCFTCFSTWYIHCTISDRQEWLNQSMSYLLYMLFRPLP